MQTDYLSAQSQDGTGVHLCSQSPKFPNPKHWNWGTQDPGIIGITQMQSENNLLNYFMMTKVRKTVILFVCFMGTAMTVDDKECCKYILEVKVVKDTATIELSCWLAMLKTLLLLCKEGTQHPQNSADAISYVTIYNLT